MRRHRASVLPRSLSAGVAFLMMLRLLASPAASALAQNATPSYCPPRVGMAAFFASELHGKRTASGEACDMWAMTAAHPTLPLGSWARVTNPRTGQQCEVRVTDRGPFNHARIIDVSYAAAGELGMLGPGSCMLEVDPLAHLNEEILDSLWDDFSFQWSPTAP